jgi:hypothetical protein
MTRPAVPFPLEKVLTPEEEELRRKQAVLVELEARLADRELELASFLADLVHFERRYLQIVGRRYAILDDLKAKIAEALARQNPKNPEVREQARQARSRAEESARAAGQEKPGEPLPEATDSSPKREQPESLRSLYRKAAKLLHPDLTLDEEERKIRHRLMAELNEAYKRGDEQRIRDILQEWHACPESVSGDGPGAELIRVIRKIAQVEKRLQAITAEIANLRQGELFKLKEQVEEADANGRDLLKELAERLDRDIAQAKEELNRVTKSARP